LFVDETQFVIVTQFGRPWETLDKAGLYFKPPYQSSLAIDRRMQILTIRGPPSSSHQREEEHRSRRLRVLEREGSAEVYWRP